MHYIDSHCHLNSPKIEPLGAPDRLVARARAAGVAGMVTICCRLAEEPAVLTDIAGRNENVWCTVGTHPHDASAEAEKAFSQDDLVDLARSHPKIIGIGESGLDYFYNLSTHEDQAESFRKHIRVCLETDLPLVVHARDADADIMKIMKEEASGAGLKGVMHCFSSTAWLAEEALDFGFYISFSGIVTFKSAGDLREIARRVPPDRMLIETDAPYLAPEPVRKAVNEPALIVNTAACLAALHDKTREEIGAITAENFFNLFTKAKDTWRAPA